MYRLPTGLCTKLAFPSMPTLGCALPDMNKQNHGFQWKSTDFKQSQKAYADDLTIIAGSIISAKKVLSLVETFLKRIRTMEAKPTKCNSLAMKKSHIVRTNGRTSTIYTPYDPQLEIDGKEIPFIH